MFLPKGYYIKKMEGMSLEQTGDGYKLSIDFTPIGVKLEKAQTALDAAVWDSVSRRMPVDTGTLKNETNEINMSERGRVFLYPPDSPYGHYQYEGTLYVDPITGKGAFYSPTYGFWSRPNTEKVPSSRKLTYSQPDAVAHWGEVAYEQDHNMWLDAVKKAMGE